MTVSWVRVAPLLLTFVAVVQAHMKLKWPTRYQWTPLEPITNNFPCGRSDPSTQSWDRTGITTTIAIGEDHAIQFECGQSCACAVHGGGSCQLSLTTDMEPTKDSKFKVFQSWEGGCPTTDGTPYSDPGHPMSYPDVLSFKIPDSFEPGNYTFVWSWIPRWSGPYEFWMNCAPVTLVPAAGSSKRTSDLHRHPKQIPDSHQHFRRENLPDMFVANIPSADEPGSEGCWAERDANVLYPDPGSVVYRNGSDGDGCNRSTFRYPTQGACAAPAATQYGWCAGSTGTTNPAKIHTSPTPGCGGSTAAVTTATATPASSAGDPSAGDEDGVLSGACSSLGQWNCIGGTQYQQCASGQWSKPIGTGGRKCQVGLSYSLWGR